jgi:hypothetical protein
VEKSEIESATRPGIVVRQESGFSLSVNNLICVTEMESGGGAGICLCGSGRHGLGQPKPGEKERTRKQCRASVTDGGVSNTLIKK